MLPSAVVTQEEQQKIVTRIDAIIQELEQLRRELIMPVQSDSIETAGIVEELFGAAGQGEIDEYDDLQGIWGRFEQ
jgi:hypothetical protein